MLRLGRAETLDQWLEELPTDVLSDDPWFFYWRAACRFYTAPRDSRRLYERAFELFAALDQPDRRGMLLTCSGAMDAMIYELDDLSLLDPWITRASDLLDEASESQWPAVQARATVSLFISLVFRQPDHAQLSIWAGRAHESLPAIEDGNARLTAQLLIAITLNYTGSFARVRQFIAAMQKACRSPHVSPLAVKVSARCGVDVLHVDGRPRPLPAGRLRRTGDRSNQRGAPVELSPAAQRCGRCPRRRGSRHRRGSTRTAPRISGKRSPARSVHLPLLLGLARDAARRSGNCVPAAEACLRAVDRSGLPVLRSALPTGHGPRAV